VKEFSAQERAELESVRSRAAIGLSAAVFMVAAVGLVLCPHAPARWAGSHPIPTRTVVHDVDVSWHDGTARGSIPAGWRAPRGARRFEKPALGDIGRRIEMSTMPYVMNSSNSSRYGRDMQGCDTYE